MIVSIDEAGVYDTAASVHRLPGIVAKSQVSIGADAHDARTGDRHGARAIDPTLGIHSDDLTVVN